MPGLIVVGSIITILPLLFLTVYAELTVQHLAQATRAVVEEGFATAAISVRLRSQTSNLERAIWQYQVLKEASLLPIISDRWHRVDQSITQLGNLRWDGKLKQEAAQLRLRFDQARQAWQSTAKSDSSTSSTAPGPRKSLQAVEHAVETVIHDSRARISKRADQLHEQTQRAQRRIVLLGIALLPLALAIGWLFTRIVTAPFKRLMQAISSLRGSDYRTPISIAFPREFSHLGERLDRLRKRLARLEEDKDRFLRQVTHELKSPLASLREGVELLDGEGLGALNLAQREVTGIMQEAGCELEELIDNLLAYAEWRFEQRAARSEWFDARELLEEVLSSHRLSMTKRNLTAKLDIGSDRVLGRRDQLRVALDNLVSNAIKHAPEHSAIEIDILSDDGKFEVSVRDWGSGVRDVDKEAIFEPFWRGTESEEQGVRGTGVGLAIVMETIRAHGGHVAVEDAHPGACFKLVWPGNTA